MFQNMIANIFKESQFKKHVSKKLIYTKILCVTFRKAGENRLWTSKNCFKYVLNFKKDKC